jgi:serine/threonine-protein kinase
MSLTGLVVLPPDVQVVPADSLPAALRPRLRSADGAWVVGRPRGRNPSKVVDAAAAELLVEFRTPRRVVDVVELISQRRGMDPRRLLAAAFPLLRDCFNARFLAAADSAEALRIEPNLSRGETVGRWTVLRSVQVLDDAEVYQVRGADGVVAALKVLRPGATRIGRQLVAREAMVLERLAGTASPALLDRGTSLGEPYLVLSWCPGVTPVVPAGEHRARRDADGDRALLRLAASIADAYQDLHTRGVVHGDVHPRNLLTDEHGTTVVLDFGLSRLSDGSDRARGVPRGAVAVFREPAFAADQLAGRTPRRATRAGDQYAVAALLYLLMTGDHYLDFPAEERAALQHITTAAPVPFASRGHEPWPAVERVLARALAKTPARRYPSMTALAEAVRRAAPRTRAPTRAAAGCAAAAELTGRVLEALGTGAAAFVSAPAAPSASITYGAAGIAYALYRMACARDDARLLSLADAWQTRAERLQHEAGAFTNPATEIVPERVGLISPYHTASGLHCVRALLCQATGDHAGANAAAQSYAAAAAASCENLDLTLGLASTLVGAAIIHDALRPAAGRGTTAVRRRADDTLAALWRTIDACPAVAECAAMPALGMAHGWAGLLYATLRWCRSSGTAPPATLAGRLSQLAECGEPAGRGLRWRARLGDADSAPGVGYEAGWCNGTAGFVHLWALAARVIGDDSYRELAERSAWNAWESAGTVGHICCGHGGRAYALLALYKHTGEAAWVDRARQLANRAADAWQRHDDSPWALSLYKGGAGLAVLGAELERPESACMPFFEDEGWPTAAATGAAVD